LAVSATGLLELRRPVLVMYSGGRDSTCLLDLAVRISGVPAVSVLHVNYGLREGSVLDERHCEATCDRLGVPLAIERPAGPTGAVNLQAWARDVRYQAATRLAAGGDIAAGHTAGDQLETILYRLISSPSRRALLGMTPRRETLVRPLLSVTREETSAYCSERGLIYRDDLSNASATFVRNRIRNELIPLLNELHPGASRNVLALAEVLRDEGEALDGVVADVVAGLNVPLHRLQTLPHGVSRLAVQRLADAALGGPAAGVARRIDDILAMGDDARLDLPGGVRAVTERSLLRFEQTPALSR
jgi:tRNA(Ile)-lysidine synthase